ncbi:MAG TPA: metalloregulator ArsR/SmtB family transcription factor [Solirubrobacterales bacterium]|jgi:DNA-binding transcriptional ArsR family regulator
MATATTFDVLAEPTRRRILDLLLDSERSVGDLVKRVKLSQPGVSKHLRVLRDAGLVSVRTEAQRRIYGVRPEPLEEVAEWLEPYRRLWAERLDALEQHLDKEAS